ncbi:TetR/AcrR family transcriptional regulator [Pseudonocardia acaciae]|uniref:TetR/AcrR family transcriptional regulator n=1 Tax=Pseudonocardia acaciae TaxID=551276 RepID=UPI00056A5670|nr:TetR family transcriptional regulator C-terminal domain-containing protein [Pseudonocardia acaciae]
MGEPAKPLSRKDALIGAILRIVGEHGLERVSVREVASAVGVSIGTVQHYFPTKDAMLVAAFSEVVRRIRARVAAVELGPDVRANLSAVLRELLPLDAVRAEEVRIQVAFAARAVTEPSLAAIQRGVLGEITAELAEAFARTPAGGDPELAARLALAGVDGLAQHAVSSGAHPPSAELTEALDHLIALLVTASAWSR